MTEQIVSWSDSEWRIVNDTVMGGLSTAIVSSIERGIRFEGMLSTEQNGGFNSIRTRILCPSDIIQDSRGIQIDWLGSARAFQLIVHLKNRQVREYYRGWMDSQPAILEWSQFEFRRRGQIDPTRCLMNDLEYIEEIGVLLSDGIDGPWWIEMNDIILLEA